MTLEFQPPYQLENPQVRQDRMAQQFGNNLVNVGNSLANYKNQQFQNQRLQQLLDIQKAEEARSASGNEPLTNFLGSSPQGPQPSGSLQQGVAGTQIPGFQGPQPQGSVDYSQGVQGPQPQGYVDHTSHFLNWMSMGKPSTYDHPDYGGAGQSRQNPFDTFDQNTYASLPAPQAERYSKLFKEKSDMEFRQSEIAKNNAMAAMYGRGGPSAGYVWKQNPFTGEYEAYPTKPGMGGAPTPNMPSGGGPRPTAGTQTGNDVPFVQGETFQARAKRVAEKPKALGSLNDTMREYDNMIKQAEMVKNDPSLDMATGMTSFTGRIPGTGARRVATNLDTLKAQTLLNVLSSLKQLSANGASGFGQLSNVEGETIKNSIASLDRSRGTADFSSGLDQFINEMKSRKENLVNTFKNTYGDAPGLSVQQKIRVRRLSDGLTGTIDAKDFDSSKYQEVKG